MNRDSHGFTLLEIAIVLVIIGLLLSGVLKGQELITNARVRNLISQQDGIKTAFFGFEDRYRAVPGDYSQADININCGAHGLHQWQWERPHRGGNRRRHPRRNSGLAAPLRLPGLSLAAMQWPTAPSPFRTKTNNGAKFLHRSLSPVGVR